MSNKRIPACAGYLTDNAVPHLADAISDALRTPDRISPSELINKAFATARSNLRSERLQAILGQCGYCGDDRTQETFVAAVKLCHEALETAFQAPMVWDRRKSARTRRNALSIIAANHIRAWMVDRGMDPHEVYRPVDGGEK